MELSLIEYRQAWADRNWRKLADHFKALAEHAEAAARMADEAAERAAALGDAAREANAEIGEVRRPDGRGFTTGLTVEEELSAARHLNKVLEDRIAKLTAPQPSGPVGALDTEALEAAIDAVRARNMFTLDGAIAQGIREYLDRTSALTASKPEQAVPGVLPANCRERLRREGKPYPRSGCAYCGDGGLRGCMFDAKL